MLELPRGWDANGHKGVFQRLQKQVREQRQRKRKRGGEGGEVVTLRSKLSLYPCIWRAAQILMIVNIESDLIFF